MFIIIKRGMDMLEKVMCFIVWLLCTTYFSFSVIDGYNFIDNWQLVTTFSFFMSCLAVVPAGCVYVLVRDYIKPTSK
jgi:hypothetical protein